MTDIAETMSTQDIVEELASVQAMIRSLAEKEDALKKALRGLLKPGSHAFGRLKVSVSEGQVRFDEVKAKVWLDGAAEDVRRRCIFVETTSRVNVDMLKELAPEGYQRALRVYEPRIVIKATEESAA